MKELGELNNHSEEFAQRGLRIIAASVDDQEATDKTQRRFPNLIELGDPERKLTEAVNALHVGAGPGKSDVAAPTTLLLDGEGKILWAFRPQRLIVRLTPGELLAEVDVHQPSKQ
jgi:peroxiredoxin